MPNQLTAVAVYYRYSSNRQDEQSIEGQRRVCQEYAAVHDLEITDEYIDRAVTGKTDKRPAFQRMIADAAQKKWTAILVYKIDRFGRSKYDIAIYKQKLSQYGMKVITAAEATLDGPEGIILESIMEGLAEFYSAELSQKIKRGMRESALKGKATGGGRCLGYRANESKDYVIDEREAECVRKIFDMYSKGTPVTHICKHLNNLGYRTVQGRPFVSSSVTRIVQNPKYIGRYRYDDILIEGGVPAIVSEDVFYLAQREVKKRRTGKQPRLPNAEYLLSGKLFCGHCRSAMVGISGTSRQGETYYYYYCSNARAKNGCTKKHVRREWIENLVVEETVRHVLHPDVLPALSKKVCAAQHSDEIAAEVSNLEAQQRDNKRKRDNIIGAIESGTFSITLQERLTTLEAEAEALKGEVAYQRSSDMELSEDEIGFMLWQYAQPPEDGDWDAYKRRIIKCFVSAVYLRDDELLIYYNTSKDGKELDSSVLDGFDQQDEKTTM